MVETAGLEPVTSTMRKAKMGFPMCSVKVQQIPYLSQKIHFFQRVLRNIIKRKNT